MSIPRDVERDMAVEQVVEAARLCVWMTNHRPWWDTEHLDWPRWWDELVQTVEGLIALDEERATP